MDPRSDHYSYAVYADPAKAASFDAERFGGPIGRLLADTQESVIVDFLAPLAGRTLLDVGTGTGRAAIALARRGAVVTAVDASAEMLGVANARARDEGVTVTFREEDAHALSCGDRSFDAVVCLRVLMHTPDWRRALGELCRVARVCVLFDYPALSSVAALQAGVRRVAARRGRPVEAYRVFTEREVRAELARHGFRLARVHRQFVLPIALHRAVGSLGFTRATEGVLAATGLRWLLGSPVTVVAERCES
ncbi:MAG TPA: class I SAM-dependent methyltransferase [Dongiaceae bacterium]|nr:class I SAM-dependent methyltransferase [Dongiaceae bacterium]